MSSAHVDLRSRPCKSDHVAMSSDSSNLFTRIIQDDGRAVARRIPVTRFSIKTPDSPEQVVEISESVVRVGSAESANDIVLDDPTVSRYHFTITWDETGPRLRDLESTNGTFVDEYRAMDIYLCPGAVIRAGRAQLELLDVGREVDEPLYVDDRFGGLVGRSASMRRLFAVLDRVAPTDTTVLVEGETGTGKELVARALHEHSLRAGGPFVVVDCASMPANMLQSELFGHERGAFTGAVGQRIGQVELAHGGTLFLDEIGELPLELQPNLLRVLEGRELRRLGGDHPTHVDIRVVAATNRDLAREVNRGTFREDLFFRLSVVRVAVPTLRERREDIPLLVEHLVGRLLAGDSDRAQQVLRRFSPRALGALDRHPWPGNVRELRNLVERTLALTDLGIGAAGRLDSPVGSPQPSGEAENARTIDLLVDLARPMIEQRTDMVELFERTYLEAMLTLHDGKVAPAARAAGLDRAYFKRLLKKHGRR